MTDQELQVVKGALNTVIGEAKSLRVPPIIQAQTGQFALVQALKTDAKVDALTEKVEALAKVVDQIATTVVKATPMVDGQNPATKGKATQ